MIAVDQVGAKASRNSSGVIFKINQSNWLYCSTGITHNNHSLQYICITEISYNLVRGCTSHNLPDDLPNLLRHQESAWGR